MESMDYLEEADHPHVINIASVAAKQGFPGSAIYCATKAGLRGFSDGLREDLAGDGFRVTTVYPPAVNTTIWDGIEGDFDPAARIEPEVVADAIYDAWAAGESYPHDVDVPGKG
jgi:short-subunit dehydrogenase